MKRIICGTDFSVHAAHAANVAAALAKRHNATLTLVHAVAPFEVEHLTKETVDAIRKRRRLRLIVEGNRLRATGAQVLDNLVLGKPDEILRATAKRTNADLIVVSSLGEVSAIRWLAGSVALRTAQKATVPTLVVRDYARLMAWAKGERPLNVFACYDFSPTSDAALRWIASLREWGPCNVTVSYVSWPPQESWRLGIRGRAADGDNAPEVQALLERGLKEKCAQLLGEADAKLHVVSTWTRPDVHLNELAKANDADLVVVGTNQRSRMDRFWVGSVSRGVIRHGRTNVACVPAASGSASEIKRVLVPTDFSTVGDEAVAAAFASAPEGAEVCLFHAARPAVSLSGVEVADEGESERTKQAAARLTTMAERHTKDRKVRTRVEVVEHRHPATAISQAAERFGADVIHMGLRRESRFRRKLRGSVTDAVKRRSCRPVMVTAR